MRKFLFYSMGFLLIFLVGCDKIDFLKPKKTPEQQSAAPIMPVAKGTVIAKVNNMPITLEELNQEVEAYNSMVSADKPEAKITTREQKINYLKTEMVRRLLLYQNALDQRLDKKEEVVQGLEKTKQDLLVMALLRQEADKIEVTSKEIEDYYNTYKEQLKEPEQRQILEIAVPNEQEAKEILIQLLQGGDFTALARERSKAASAKSGGNLGFIQKRQKPAQFDEVAFSDALEVGKTSNIFKGPDGLYYILKLEAKSGGQQKSLSELWDDIKRGLLFLKQQQKIEDLLGKLSRDSKIEISEGQIK